jgi:hypothetical protein
MSEYTSPNFFILGASRSGTSSLYYYLREHEDLFMPEPKELRFFDRDENYNQGLNYYERQFESWNGEKAVGEASPPYWYRGIKLDSSGKYQFDPADDAPTRIAEVYPDVKLILTLRNPVRRAYSQYWKNVRQGREDIQPFRAAVEAELDDERDHKSSELCWVYKNDYPLHVEHIFNLFPRENIKVLIFEEWIKDIESTLNEICEFLSISPRNEWNKTDKAKNAAKVPRSHLVNKLYHNYLAGTIFGPLINWLNLREGYPEMPTETEQFLFDIFEGKMTSLERILNRDLDLWRKKITGT